MCPALAWSDLQVRAGAASVWNLVRAVEPQAKNLRSYDSARDAFHAARAVLPSAASSIRLGAYSRRQQFRHVLLRHFPDKLRLQILVVMHHNVAGAKKARPGISGWARRNGSSSLRAASPMIVMFRHTASIIRALAGQSAPPVAVYSAMRRQQARMCIKYTSGSFAGIRYRGTASARTLSRMYG